MMNLFRTNKIAVYEKNPVILDLIIYSLVENHYLPIGHFNKCEFLTSLKRVKFDDIILDLDNEIEQNFELTNEIERISPNARLFYTISKNNLKLIPEHLKLKAILIKPIDLHKLLQLLLTTNNEY